MEIMLELTILICLVLVIALLSIDKVRIVRGEKPPQPNRKDKKLADIMGKPLIQSKEVIPAKMTFKKAAERKSNSPSTIHKEPVDIIVPKSDITDDFSDAEDIVPPDDDRFGQGVSLDELMKVGNLLQQNSMDEIQEQETVKIMQKIEGTELYGLLESSIGDASKRIARLLDRNLNNNQSADYGLEDNFDKFNIDDFI